VRPNLQKTKTQIQGEHQKEIDFVYTIFSPKKISLQRFTRQLKIFLKKYKKCGEIGFDFSLQNWDGFRSNQLVSFKDLVRPVK